MEMMFHCNYSFDFPHEGQNQLFYTYWIGVDSNYSYLIFASKSGQTPKSSSFFKFLSTLKQKLQWNYRLDFSQ